MKFGKRIRYLALQKWSDGYIDYKHLKKVLKGLMAIKLVLDEDNHVENDIVHNTNHSNNNALIYSAFHKVVLQELEKANQCCKQVMYELESVHHNLKLQIPSTYSLEIKDIFSLRNISNDLIDHCIKIDSLRKFIVLNYLAIVKIAKKFDKIMEQDKKNEIIQFVCKQPFYSSFQLDTLYNETCTLQDQIIYILNEKKTIENNSLNERCPICLTTFKSPVILSCHHAFCWQCLSNATEHKMHSCPICRKEQSLDPRDYEMDGLIRRILLNYSKEIFDQEKEMNENDKQILLLEVVNKAKKHLQQIELQYSLLRSVPKYDDEKNESDNFHFLKKDKKIFNVAHRGASGVKKGNTIAAFEEAHRQEVDMIELDVQLCRSGEIVVYHDLYLPHGQSIKKLSLKEILQYDPDIPTLDQVLYHLRTTDLSIYFDLKDPDIVPSLMNFLLIQVDQYQWKASKFLIASFNHYQLLEVNSYRIFGSPLEKIRTVALTSNISFGYTKSFEDLGISFVAVSINIITSEYVMDAHSRNIGVLVWTVNHLSDAQQLLELSVDGLIGDYPEIIHQAINEYLDEIKERNHDNLSSPQISSLLQKKKSSIHHQQDDSILSIAYQGSSGSKPPNTIESIMESIHLGADMIHVVLQMCASGHIILYHQLKFEDGTSLKSLPLEEILKREPSIPTLNAVLDAIDSSIFLYLDITSGDILPYLMDILYGRIENEGWSADQFFIASYDHYQLAEINGYRVDGSCLKNIRTVAVTSSIPIGLAKCYHDLNIYCISIDVNILTKEFITDAQSRGFKVFLWTVNHFEQIQQCIQFSIQGIITKFPDQVVSALDQTFPKRKKHHSKNVDFSINTTSNVYEVGKTIEIMNKSNGEIKWYPGIIINHNKDEKDTYSILWKINDHSQRNSRHVLPCHIRHPQKKHNGMTPLYTATADALRYAASWATSPILKGIRHFASTSENVFTADDVDDYISCVDENISFTKLNEKIDS